VYSTRLHVYTRASLTDILARKSARVGQVSADKLARILVRVRLVASWTRRGTPTSGEDVRVGVAVGVGVGPMEFKLTEQQQHIDIEIYNNHIRTNLTGFVVRRLC